MMSLLASLLLPSLAQGFDPAVQVTPDDSRDTQAIAAMSGSLPDVVALLFNDASSAGVGFALSTDAGTTWTEGGIPPQSGYLSMEPRDLELLSNGTIAAACSLDYFFSTTYFSSSGVDGGVLTSSNGGATWDLTSFPLGGGEAHASLDSDDTGSPYDGQLYVHQVSSGSFGIGHNLKLSTDGGATFQTKTFTGQLAERPGEWPDLEVGPDGEVYSVYRESSIGLKLKILQSLDGWQNISSITIASYAPGDALGVAPELAVDRSAGAHRGTLYVTAWVRPSGSSLWDLRLYTSTDQGSTWSSGTSLSFVPSRTSVSGAQALSVDERGRLDLLFDGAGLPCDLQHARSVDGGATWDLPNVVHQTASYSGLIQRTALVPRPGGNGALAFWTAAEAGDEDLYMSSGDLALWPASSVISNSAPVATGISLDGGPALGGKQYAVLGSASGTSPGFIRDGVLIPLVIDSAFNQILNLANTPPLANFQGILDATGRATATFDPPAGALSAIVGGTLSFAWVSHTSGVVETASHPVGMQVLP